VKNTLSEILGLYLVRCSVWWWFIAFTSTASAVIVLMWRRSRSPDSEPSKVKPPVGLLITACAAGLAIAVMHANLVDDAFISFRYARNLVEGHGLVYNIGERVEGYSNFLWTLLVGLMIRITALEAPIAALVLCLISFVANLTVVFAIGLRLSREKASGRYLPLAIVLLALQSTFVSFATSGLETMASSLLVNLGVLLLLQHHRPVKCAWSGLLFILATLTHPDHAIFYVAAGATLLILYGLPVIRSLRERRGVGTPWRNGLNRLVFYAAPFLLYLVYLAWKLSYYGELLPNTYYAKSASTAWYGQGALYAASFYLGSHLWVAVALSIVWLCKRSERRTVVDFKIFFVLTAVAYNWYVVRVGGDFMFGRFYVSLIPLLLLACENLIHSLASATRGLKRTQLAPLLVTAALLGGTAYGVPLIERTMIRWGIADEGSFYRVVSWAPVVVDHSLYRDGRFLYDTLTARGHDPVIASTAHGMHGYYSRLTLIDMRGLTDSFIARMPLRTRRRPGHEKWPTKAYLTERGVRFSRSNPHPSRFKKLAELGDDNPLRGKWSIFIYDRELMRGIRKTSPEFGFTDFETYLDGYISEMTNKSAREIQQDFAWFRSYYFDHNDDRERLAPFMKVLERGAR
jgi:hypothetical protein